ncbi:MAG: hypothetical protein SF069_14695 [Phycisphaerae bacterium]|nr:hypothetical protein [Phycisphaerae bacterium]
MIAASPEPRANDHVTDNPAAINPELAEKDQQCSLLRPDYDARKGAATMSGLTKSVSRSIFWRHAIIATITPAAGDIVARTLGRAS